MNKKRYVIVDDMRGLILISMMLYHTMWNIVNIFGEKWRWYQSDFVYWWQQSICWGFILLSGFCWSFGRKKWKRGLMVFAAGLLVSIVTGLFMPENMIRFGVLTCLGSCMLLMIPLHKLVSTWEPLMGGSISFFLFLITRNINKGGLGFEVWQVMSLPESWYANSLTAYLGCPPEDFYSTDYFSIFPWFFLFLTGYFIYRLVERKKWFSCLKLTKEINKAVGLEWLGRHSLLIYLLHQPIIYGILCLYYI